jgi:hypothetical protein
MGPSVSTDRGNFFGDLFFAFGPVGFTIMVIFDCTRVEALAFLAGDLATASRLRLAGVEVATSLVALTSFSSSSSSSSSSLEEMGSQIFPSREGAEEDGAPAAAGASSSSGEEMVSSSSASSLMDSSSDSGTSSQLASQRPCILMTVELAKRS